MSKKKIATAVVSFCVAVALSYSVYFFLWDYKSPFINRLTLNDWVNQESGLSLRQTNILDDLLADYETDPELRGLAVAVIRSKAEAYPESLNYWSRSIFINSFMMDPSPTVRDAGLMAILQLDSIAPSLKTDCIRIALARPINDLQDYRSIEISLKAITKYRLEELIPEVQELAGSADRFISEEATTCLSRFQEPSSNL